MKICTQFLLGDVQPANEALRIAKNKKGTSSFSKTLLFVFLFLSSISLSAQLGVYEFTGTGACPNQNPAVSTQPATAVFSDFSSVSTTCEVINNQFGSSNWNTGPAINLSKYIEFTVTPNSGYVLNLASLSFVHSVDENGSGPGTGNTAWVLRSSLNSYAANIATGSANQNTQTAVVTLPAGSFTNIGAVTFRLYMIEIKKNSTVWTIDDVTVNGASVILPANPGNPTSNAPQCSNPGVILTANGTAPAGETWYWQTSATGTSTANSGTTYTVTTVGTYYIRSQDNTTLAWSAGAGSLTVTIIPDVSVPVFSSGATSVRCQGAGTVTYSATATNSTGITYSLDAASFTGGNSIDPSTGTVTYVAGWSGVSVITASAAGCSGPKTATHTITTTSAVGIPSFTLGATSTRCQGNGTVTYTATATNATGITYSLDAASISGGITINGTTGAVNYISGWSGTTIVTATATGCSTPATSTHTITITPTVGTPVFAAGATSTRCFGSGTGTYTATATNATAITYSIDLLSVVGGCSINASTGAVNFSALWVGTTTITASAAGCNGPKTATHTITITGAVGTPVFAVGSNSTRCQGAATTTYNATATNNGGITYSLDAGSIGGGITINPLNGAVTYIAGWTGVLTITATASGCNGPTTATHTVTTNATLGTLAFTAGATSTRCQGAGTVTYDASATAATGITYSLNAASISGGNSISPSTGVVTYVAGWSGTSTITATATGCGGPATAIHTVTITPTVGTPVFSSGATSSRCQGAGAVTYTATSTNNTGITYSLNAASITAGNTIDPSNGAVTYVAGWSGASVITATATGCNGPRTATHTATTNATIGIPVFASGATSTRCQAGGTVSYAATAANTTAITYTIDAGSLTGGNTINSFTGVVAYAATWSGTTIITATATGCGGPTTSTHTATVTATVGTPVFAAGTTSTRCQGNGIVSYSATATTTTGIIYSLDAASISGGNIINASTGDVTFAAGWSGTSIVTATAAGCNGPKTATHTITITASVGIPVFALGAASVRTQGAGTVTYTATATTTTGITYILDAASVSGGNTINAATGAVTWTAGWNGTSSVTANAAGCNGPSTATHIITINANVVQTPLYLSTPGQILDRVDPVSTGIAATVQSGDIATTGAGTVTNITFTQSPVLCNDLVIKGQTISIAAYVSITSGTMPASPAITATLKYGSTNIISFSNPIYNSTTKVLTWTGVLGADATVPTGQALALQFTTAQAGVVFKIEYHSATKPSRISLLPVSTFIDITSFKVYNAPYPGGSVRISGNPNTTYYARSVATTPFGYKDITGLSVTITPPGTIMQATCIDSSACTRTYEYSWTTSATVGNYSLMATAREGYENIIKNSELLNFTVCTVCAPVAVDDSTAGAGGAPILVDVLANDYDANNNIKPTALTVFTQPSNGTGYYSNGMIVYLPNGSYAGKDTLTYQICDSTGLCGTGKVFFTINPFLVDPCSEATKSHTFYLPFSENEARIALDSSTNTALVSNNIRTIISMKMPYPGMVIVWDHWEDGYETNALNPMQATTQVWGDGNPYNGITPGYNNDIIPAGGSIVLDNIIATNPRVASIIKYDGRDKIFSSGQITVTQVCGEPSIMQVQCMKTNVAPVNDYGTSFTIPVGENFNSQDFNYTSLFIRASQNNTVINIDKDNNGTFETTATINEGQVYHVNGGVLTGATVAASLPIGIDLHFGGNDSWSSRDVPLFPATWYYHTYYSPVPTTGSSTAVKDSAAVMLYNSLNRPLIINWTSGVPSSGNITLPAKTVVRFPLVRSTSAAYKFTNPTGESFTAIEICDSYTPGGGGNQGHEYDWSFNLIAQNRLTDFATVAWAPGSIDGSRNDNPVWVTPTANTTIYVKYDGNVSGTSGLISPCGMRYDESFTLNALNHRRLKDISDNDQSGLAVFTCDGTKLAAVYGEDASTAVQANPSWDVGSTIQPFCKQKLIFANDDYSRTMVNQPVTIPVLLNDFGFLAVIDPTTVNNTGLLQAHHGTILINANGTIIYTPAPGYVGKDTFEYNVCSTPSPVVCDMATVYVDIAVCPAPFNQNVISGNVFLDKNDDGINNDGGTGVAGTKVYLYINGNCDASATANELKDSVIVDQSGTYQFVTYPEKFVEDDFDGTGGTSTCASGNDGNADWIGSWSDINDPSNGFCVNGSVPANDAEIIKDGGFGFALRLKDNNVSATRRVNLSGASYAFLSFSYRRKSANLAAGEDVIVQASSDGSTFGTVFTIAGDGTADANYVTIYNQDITLYANTTTYIRFLTNNLVDDGDTVYIDNVKVQFLRYPQCYITKLDVSSVPAYHHTTTLLQHAFTATSTVTCLSPYDFGVAKNKISISGTFYNDANGVTDNLVNGSAMGTVSGVPVYAYLVDTSNKVAFRTTVNSAAGTYSFPTADVLTNYKAVLSTSSVNLGDTPPPTCGVSGVWTNTGDAYGVNNLAGTGIKAGVFNASIAVNTNISNVTNVNFGIERLPNSDNYLTTIPYPTIGQFIVLNGGANPPILSGNDPEDYVAGGVLTGKALIIDSLPNNAELQYNNIVVTKGQLINAFNPSLLRVKITSATMGSSSITFRYSYVDIALLKDPSPATYTLVWAGVLPAEGLMASVNLNGNLATVKWSTLSEHNTDHFTVERSLDNRTFIAVGSNITAAGNSSTKRDYQQPDNISSLMQNDVIYYRVKLADIDGKFKYSNIVPLRLSQKPGVTIWPNPFQSSINVSITAMSETVVDISIIDISGRNIKTVTQSVSKGITTIAINGLTQLPAGPYLIEITDKKAGTTYQKVLKNGQ